MPYHALLTIHLLTYLLTCIRVCCITHFMPSSIAVLQVVENGQEVQRLKAELDAVRLHDWLTKASSDHA